MHFGDQYKQKIKIGTRNSKLARTQTQITIDYIKSFYNNIEFEILQIITKGDVIQDKPLYDIGGKALFTKEIENSLLNHEIDIAIHSAKDIEDQYQKDFLTFPCILPEADNRDVFIGKNYQHSKSSLINLPNCAIIGSSSVRREAQIKLIRPDVKFEPIRGNVDTRLKKLLETNLDGIILANAGLQRINVFTKNMEIMDRKTMMPAISQGIIAIQSRKENIILNELLNKITHRKTHIKFQIYRAFVEAVNGSCTTPLAANIKIINNKIHAKFLIVSRNGTFIYKTNIIDEIQNSEKIGLKAGLEIKQYLHLI